jgi:LEA14-like dessication related protein
MGSFAPSRRHLLASTPGLVLLAAGCPKVPAGIGKAIKKYLPTVAFNNVKLHHIDFDKVDLSFLFDVNNPAPLKVALSSLSYALALEGTQLFQGDKADGVTLKPEAAAPLNFPMTLRWADLIELFKKIKGRDELDFGLSGHLGFNTPVGEARLPYDAAGAIPALHRPTFALQGIELKEFKPLDNRARIAINLGVTNHGGSVFSFKGFDYKLKLGGNSVASGIVDALGEVKADSTDRLTLPIDLSLTDVGGAIIDAFAKKGRLQTQVSAGLEVGTPFGDIPLSIDESGKLDIG